MANQLTNADNRSVMSQQHKITTVRQTHLSHINTGLHHKPGYGELQLLFY